MFPVFSAFFKFSHLRLVFFASGLYTGASYEKTAGERVEIPIVYSDDSLVVCRKPVGVDSEGAGLPALLRAQLKAPEVYCVHRLDKAVGGVMVYALTRESAAALSRQMGAGGFQKEYLAVAHGSLSPAEGTLTDLLFHDRAKNKSYVVRRRRAGVKEAVLSYRVIAEREGLSLLQVRLQTGRTHQIRVQFASRGHPLAGDAKYGSPLRDCRVALFSRALSFRHPGTGEPLSFSAPPPEERPWDIFLNMEENDAIH